VEEGDGEGEELEEGEGREYGEPDEEGFSRGRHGDPDSGKHVDVDVIVDVDVVVDVTSSAT